MNLRHLLVFGLAAWLLTACQMVLPPAPGAPGAAPGAAFTLAAGRSIAIAGESAQIGLQQYVDDRRCPSGATCNESGPVKLQIALVRAGHSTAYPVFSVYTDATGNVLPDAPGSSATAKVGPYQIALIAVTPYPVDQQAVPLGDYQATFVVTTDPTALPDTDADMRVITDQPFILAPGEQVNLVGRDVALQVDSVIASTAVTAEVTLSWLDGASPAQPIHLSAKLDDTGVVQPAQGLVRSSVLYDGVIINLLNVKPAPADEPVDVNSARVTLALAAPQRMPFATEFAEPTQPVALTPGHTAVIGAEQILISFDRVLTDTRCPSFGTCVDAGEVQILVIAANEDMRQTGYVVGGFTDQTGALTDPPSFTHGGYTVRLTQVAPYPEQAGAAIPDGAYTATFVVDAPAGQAPTVPQTAPEVSATPAGELRPLLCVNFMAALLVSEGAPTDAVIRFTDPVAQNAATDYGAVHALCNKTIGPEWVHADITSVKDVESYLPADTAFWVWDGMAGSLTPYPSP